MIENIKNKTVASGKACLNDKNRWMTKHQHRLGQRSFYIQLVSEPLILS